MLSAFGVEHTEISKGALSDAMHWLGIGSKKYAQTQNQLRAVANAGPAKSNPMLDMVAETKGFQPPTPAAPKPKRTRKPKAPAPEPAPAPAPAPPPFQFKTGNFNAQDFGAKDMTANWAKKHKKPLIGAGIGTGAVGAGGATAYGLQKK